ncbi:6-carboxytetrahydropterin synthase QueD [Actinomadura graeca]|uniref:6-carboxy-5,6,7,8-tetrahydropterin synthase n=1 Tax=Actinomadura graeca TaxID=2750812 RepID=A0ABX8R475_9ACTN|nr:6-carboxytetrahydropterin synthase QueD [Actinomadura graeca]QXJ25862.1 6-carboxytetrahydropterin synthase QueD [Actinomadura graeca]
MIVFKEFRFEAAHQLPRVPPGHKCGRVHGHSYLLKVSVDGEVDGELGWVIDFADIGGPVKTLVGRLDHRLLNDIPGLDNPTCEVLARWVWEQLIAQLPVLSEVAVWETATSGAIYRGQ